MCWTNMFDGQNEIKTCKDKVMDNTQDMTDSTITKCHISF